MAFVASLIAYLGAVGGIVAAFLIALAALLATPDQGPNPTRAAVTAHQPTLARAATAAGPKATPLNTAKGQIVKGQIAKAQIAKSQLAKAQIAKDQTAKSQQLANVQSRTGQRVAQDEREQHAPSSGARPHAGQWAYQQESDMAHRDLGEAEQPDNPFDRIW
jgi:hypothetical protein